MLPVEWRPHALNSLENIAAYLNERNPYAAEVLLYAIEQTVEALPQHPYLYRHGRVLGTREAVVHPNYLLVYRIAVDHIAIIDVLHARREYP
ncbi:type II toxin-antitoxin system RelE/ParE family toxin [Halomonas urumqiensis]|uniref:type II toxin-antitoxin system RelE/ParE family toxin n=1 Tax=Halomonas urumqiensis TaxID=1684789 RepID=UPI000D178ED3|nr:type II toxin-antitoxin system RelE/ParE family toxin [Halomonas urumqiensis]PTB03999.1 type II toxin-antitoxin system mRNA interferase toxin, RelE/StbE family [Halomonas urumqiensis]GHE19739.1 addiction module antitoxin [Halomonas urumqiensis]